MEYSAAIQLRITNYGLRIELLRVVNYGFGGRMDSDIVHVSWLFMKTSDTVRYAAPVISNCPSREMDEFFMRDNCKLFNPDISYQFVFRNS